MKISPISPIQRIPSTLPKPIKVIFKKTRTGIVIAIFPELPGTNSWWKDCLSYTLTDGFKPLDYGSIGKISYATPKERETVIKELSKLGYRVEIITSFQSIHLTKRKIAVEQQL